MKDAEGRGKAIRLTCTRPNSDLPGFRFVRGFVFAPGNSGYNTLGIAVSKLHRSGGNNTLVDGYLGVVVKGGFRPIVRVVAGGTGGNSAV